MDVLKRPKKKVTAPNLVRLAASSMQLVQGSTPHLPCVLPSKLHGHFMGFGARRRARSQEQPPSGQPLGRIVAKPDKWFRGNSLAIILRLREVMAPVTEILNFKFFRLLVTGRELLLEFLEPVLDEDHFGDRRGLSLLELDHEESLSILGQIIAAYGVSRRISGPLKKQARLAGREAAVSPDVHNPHLILPSVEKLFPISCPQRLDAPLAGYLVFHPWTGKGPT